MRSLRGLRVGAAVLLGAISLSAQSVSQQSAQQQSVAPQTQATPPPAQQAASDLSKLIDTESTLGSFTLGDQKFAVVTHEKGISHATNPELAVTTALLEIREANQNVVYQEPIPYDVQDGHFARRISASASMLSGGVNSAIVIRILDESPAGHEDESFQVFGLVNGKLASFGAPLPLGQAGSGTAVGDVLTGVMVGGGVDVEPLMSTAEVLEFRAWTGNFFVSVPVRVDWAHGRWSEGEECFALSNGGNPKQRGCNLGVAASGHALVDGSRVTLYAEPVEDHYAEQSVPVNHNSAVVFLGVQALVNWKNVEERFACTFDNLWLHVRVDGREGWTHSEADFAALGQPASIPPQ